MATVKDVAKELGVSERTVQRWLGTLRQHLNGAIRQEGRRVVLSDDAVDILRRIAKLRHDGTSLKEAIAEALGIEEDTTEASAAATSEPGRETSRQWRDVVMMVAVAELGLIAVGVLLLAIRAWVR